MDWAVLIVTPGSFIASFVNAAFATGGVYILLFSSSSVLPLTAAVPLQSAFAAASLIARVALFWEHIEWRIVWMFFLGCFLGVGIGAWTFAALPEQVIALLLGIVLLFLIWMPRLPSLPLKRPLILTGVVHSYLGSLFGVGGVLQPLLLRTDLLKMQLTGTLAAAMLSLDVFKALGYSSCPPENLPFRQSPAPNTPDRNTDNRRIRPRSGRLSRIRQQISCPGHRFRQFPAYVDAPGSASWISDIMWHAVKVRSYVRPLDAAFIRRGPVWCSWIGSKSLPRARSPASGAGFSDPVFNDLLPLCCLSSSPHQPGSSADQAVRAVPAAPGIPFREVEPLLSRQLSFPGSHAAAAIAAGAR